MANGSQSILFWYRNELLHSLLSKLLGGIHTNKQTVTERVPKILKVQILPKSHDSYKIRKMLHCEQHHTYALCV